MSSVVTDKVKGLLTRIGFPAPSQNDGVSVLVASSGALPNLDRMLRQAGADVHYARTVDEARDRSASHRYDIAVVDLRGEPGWDFVEAIRPNAPVVGVVERESAAIRGLLRGLDAALNMGAVGLEELIWTVRRVSACRKGEGCELSEGVRQRTEQTLHHVSEVLQAYAAH